MLLKIKKDFDLNLSVTFEESLSKTTDWYLVNKYWMKLIVSGQYKSYYQKNRMIVIYKYNTIFNEIS